MSNARTVPKHPLIAVAIVLSVPMVVIAWKVVVPLLYLAIALPPPTPLPPLHRAVATGDIAQVEALCNAGAMIDEQAYGNDSQPDGATALYIAARRGDHDMVLLLLSHGASVTQKIVGGDQAIHAAHASVIADLLEAGADIEARTEFKQTPLMCQVILHRDGADVEGIRLLLAAGANPLARDMYGRTAADLLADFSDSAPKLVQLLRDAEQGSRKRRGTPSG